MVSRIVPAPQPAMNGDTAGIDITTLVSMTVAERVREAISIGAALAPRSLQRHIGPSELGMTCDRALAYRVSGTLPTGQSKSDPLRPLVGTGVHLVMAEHFRRLDGRAGRFLVEFPVSYRGIAGSVDLVDRRHRLAVDWKSTTKAKIKRIAHDGPPARYIVQAMTYAAGLIEAGEVVENIALVYLAVDGDLSDVHTIVRPFDRGLADTAIDRYEAISRQLAGSGPATVPSQPSNMCQWCDFYRPHQDPDDSGCPGTTEATTNVQTQSKGNEYP